MKKFCLILIVLTLLLSSCDKMRLPNLSEILPTTSDEEETSSDNTSYTTADDSEFNDIATEVERNESDTSEQIERDFAEITDNSEVTDAFDTNAVEKNEAPVEHLGSNSLKGVPFTEVYCTKNNTIITYSDDEKCVMIFDNSGKQIYACSELELILLGEFGVMVALPDGNARIITVDGKETQSVSSILTGMVPRLSDSGTVYTIEVIDNVAYYVIKFSLAAPKNDAERALVFSYYFSPEKADLKFKASMDELDVIYRSKYDWFIKNIDGTYSIYRINQSGVRLIGTYDSMEFTSGGEPIKLTQDHEVVLLEYVFKNGEVSYVSQKNLVDVRLEPDVMGKYSEKASEAILPNTSELICDTPDSRYNHGLKTKVYRAGDDLYITGIYGTYILPIEEDIVSVNLFSDDCIQLAYFINGELRIGKIDLFTYDNHLNDLHIYEYSNEYEYSGGSRELGKWNGAQCIEGCYYSYFCKDGKIIAGAWGNTIVKIGDLCAIRYFVDVQHWFNYFIFKPDFTKFSDDIFNEFYAIGDGCYIGTTDKKEYRFYDSDGKIYFNSSDDKSILSVTANCKLTINEDRILQLFNLYDELIYDFGAVEEGYNYKNEYTKAYDKNNDGVIDEYSFSFIKGVTYSLPYIKYSFNLETGKGEVTTGLIDPIL